MRLLPALLCLTLFANPIRAAETRWGPIGGDTSTQVKASGDIRGADGATVRVQTTDHGGAMTVLDASALRGHEVALSAEIEASDGASAFLWLRADGDERNLAFLNGADAPVRTGEGPQRRRLQLYLPLASSSLALGVVQETAGSTLFRDMRVEILPDVPSKADARSVLSAMLDAAQTHALASSKVDWPGLRARLLSDALAGQPAGEAYTRFREIARALGDRHSFVTPPAATADYAAKAAPTAPVRAWARDGVGYVSVPGLRGTGASAAALFARDLCGTLSKLRPQVTLGWIVDLRGDSGGNMWPMLSGIKPLLDTDRAGSFRYGDGRLAPWRIEGVGGCDWASDAPVAVLIGRGTSSSGEAVAVAFRGRPRTRFFGAPTAGVSTSNEGFPLPDGGSAWITTSIDVDRTGTAYPAGLKPDEQAADGDAAVQAALHWLAATP